MAWPPSRGALLGAAGALGVLALYLLVGVVRHVDLLFQGITAEDAFWIRGTMLGSTVRLTSSYLLHDLGLHHFGERIIGYRVMGVAIHVANAYLLFWVYLLLGRQMRTWAGVRPDIWRGGALLAGMLFLNTQMYTMAWLSAFAYLVVTLLCLLSMTLALLSLRLERGLPWGWLLWILSAGAYHLSLYSHSFALLLPLFIGLLEIASRRTRWDLRGLASAAARYALYALVLGRFVQQNWSAIFEKGMAIAPAGMGPGELLKAAMELQMVRLNNAVLHPFFGLDRGYTFPPWPLLALLLLVAVLGGIQVFSPSRRLGLTGVLALFYLVWWALTLPQELVAPTVGAHWRGYYLAAGVAVVMAAALVQLLALGSRYLPGAPRTTLRGLMVLAALGLLVSNQGISLARLGKVLSPGTAWRHAETWTPDARCGGLERLTAGQAAARVKAGGRFTCADLGFLDLTGIDLRGADLSGARLTGARLRGADLTGAKLDRACLVWADLERATAGGASLRGADLSGTTMTGASLVSADLTGAVLRWTLLNRADLRGVTLDGALLLETQLLHADLRGVDLTVAEAHTATLAHARLEGARVPEKLRD